MAIIYGAFNDRKIGPATMPAGINIRKYVVTDMYLSTAALGAKRKLRNPTMVNGTATRAAVRAITIRLRPNSSDCL